MLSAIEQWADHRPWRRRLALALLFFTALTVLAVGIGEPTGVTGKDEYYLSLRTPMCMVEQDVWWVPCLDGEPRLKKPPMVYWLTRASYEAFGVNLVSARLVVVTLSAAMVLGIALIALEFASTLAAALLAGLTSLSFLSLFVSGRMLELDLPVATFSTLAFYVLMRWYHGGGWPAVLFASALLAAGFLTKGPIVFIVCGGGALALLALDPNARCFLRQHWIQAAAMLGLFLVLALPWFVHVSQLYPDSSARELTKELSDRQFFRISAVPIYGTLLLALPWSFVAIGRLVGIRALPKPDRQRMLVFTLWLALTLLPFFFIKTFERYLFGSLVPLALILAHQSAALSTGLRWAARLGMGLILPILLTVYLLAMWLYGPSVGMALAIPAFGWFLYQWWTAGRQTLMAVSAILLWMFTMGVIYPKLGINRIPEHIVETASESDIALFHGPQPAMLPAVLGRSLIHLDDRWRLPDHLTTDCDGFLLFAQADESRQAREGLETRNFDITHSEQFGILSSKVSWQNMTRRGVTRNELFNALKNRDLEPIMPQVVMFTAKPSQCPDS